MDLETIRKINDLSKELQKHHFAETSIDAIKDATKIYEDQSIVPQETQQQIEPVTNEVQQSQESNSSTIIERKYKLLLEMNNKRFERDIQNLNNTVQELAQQIMSLKTELFKISQNSREQKVNISELKTDESQKIQEENEKPSANYQPQTTDQKPPTIKEQHPRQGNYQSKDVAIEKFFYYGSKK